MLELLPSKSLTPKLYKRRTSISNRPKENCTASSSLHPAKEGAGCRKVDRYSLKMQGGIVTGLNVFNGADLTDS
eukprot:5749097-Pyramimonas_sp.AAC.1